MESSLPGSQEKKSPRHCHNSPTPSVSAVGGLQGRRSSLHEGHHHLSSVSSTLHPLGKTISRTEEYLSRVSTELANEALIGAQYPLSPDLPMELKKLDQGTQMSRHVLPTTRTKGTDTRSDRNRTRNKTHLLPSREMVETVRPKETLDGTMFLPTQRSAWKSPTIPEGITSLTSKKEQGNIKREALDSMEGNDREADFLLGKIFQPSPPTSSKSSDLQEVLKQRLDDQFTKRL
ncbi:uncharacterized protein LOC141495686 [Macrotis lagotis]|uniref:uncharacterized protein LOC141495686 n=1 Tax=Macrotis lagotis TaxID=92651 RepID=UPI003D691FB8